MRVIEAEIPEEKTQAYGIGRRAHRELVQLFLQRSFCLVRCVGDGHGPKSARPKDHFV